MSLVEEALSRPPDQRRAFVANACGKDTETFYQVWGYVEQEDRMAGFLLTPLIGRDEPEEFFHPGEDIDGRFRIIRKIAEGGMGIVYDAYDLRLERRIAIKCARRGHNSRLPPEVRHASDISHPNVCKIYEIHTAQTERGDVDFITMEYLDGETLSQRLRSGPIPEKTGLLIAKQLCAGLAEAHAQHVIHGDLKSNNIILTEGPDGSLRAVITDFGLAQRWETAQHVAQSQNKGGTPDYMAPELWDGQKASVRSDIYALGVILYELATGRVPFPHDREITRAERFRRKAPPANPRWDKTIGRCLQPYPTLRFGSAAEVALALEGKKSRRAFFGAVAAALLVGAAAGVAVYRNTPPPVPEIRLTALPITDLTTAGPVAQKFHQDVLAEIAKLRGGPDVAFRTVASESEATHLFRFGVNGVDVHASLQDKRSGRAAAEWTVQYSGNDLKYAPAALAGFVTWRAGLPPRVPAAVAAAAAQDFEQGASLVRHRSKTDDALTLLNRASAADPDSALIWATLAEAQSMKYSFTHDKAWLDRAAESTRQAVLRDPDVPAVHRIAGLMLLRTGGYEEAVARFSRAGELEPSNSDAWRRLGEAYRRQRQINDALAYLKKATETEPNYFRTWWDLGGLYQRMGDYTAAAQALEKAVALGPGESGVRRPLAEVYICLGRYADAEREIMLELGLEETPQALRILAVTYMQRGRDAEAVQYIEKATQRAPGVFWYWMDLGTCFRRTGRPLQAREAYSKAMQLAESALAIDARSGGTHAYVGYLAAQLGDARRAETEIGQALNLLPTDADVQFNAALTWEALGKRDQTLQVARTMNRQTLEDLSRWPDVASLTQDPRFLQLKTASAISR
jgi:tetratricopeptide (TPR) repeat protein